MILEKRKMKFSITILIVLVGKEVLNADQIADRFVVEFSHFVV
jgi:hypothetical protein